MYYILLFRYIDIKDDSEVNTNTKTAAQIFLEEEEAKNIVRKRAQLKLALLQQEVQLGDQQAGAATAVQVPHQVCQEAQALARRSYCYSLFNCCRDSARVAQPCPDFGWEEENSTRWRCLQSLTSWLPRESTAPRIPLLLRHQGPALVIGMCQGGWKV